MKMKIILLLSVFGIGFNGFAQYQIEVSSIGTLSGGNTYLLNATANQLQFALNKCAFGNSAPQFSTNYTLNWYSNNVNSTIGGTVVNPGYQNQITLPNLVSETISFTPSTNVTGTKYYYAIISNPSSTGCGFTGTLVSTIQQVTVNAPATHLNFDGVDDKITITGATSLPLGNTSRTIEAWVKTSQNNVGGCIVSYGNNPANNRFGLYQTGGKLNFVAQGNDYNTNVTINDNVWHHVAATFDGTSLKIYLDGVQVGSTQAKTFATAGTTFTIGNETVQGEFFAGNIDEVRVWNIARTADEIARSRFCELASQTGLVAYYQFNQGADSSSNTGITSLTATTGSNGTLSSFALMGATSNWLAGSPVTTGSTIPNSPSVSTPLTYNQGATASALTATGTLLKWYTVATAGTALTSAPTPVTTTAGTTSYWVASSNSNGCESTRVQITVNVIATATHLNFDGIDDGIISANSATTNLENQTFEAMFKIPSIPADADKIFQRGTDASGGWSSIIGVTSTGKLQGLISASVVGDLNIVGTTTIAPNVWYQAALVFQNNNSLKLYLNGNLEGFVTISSTVTLRNSDNKIRVGQGSGLTSEYFKGDIDEVRVWNRSLSATEINNLKNCELQASQTGVVTYYKFNQGFDASNNTAVTTATDSSGNSNNGTLTNFALNGTTSNWVAGSPIITGNTCTSLNANSSVFGFNNLSIYPNPFTNQFTIAIEEEATATVYNVLGAVIASQKLNNGNNTFEVSNLASGVYLVKIANEKGSQIVKMVKN